MEVPPGHGDDVGVQALRDLDHAHRGLGVDDHLTDGQEVGPLVLGGRLAVVDYLPGDTPHGPAAPVRVDPETVKTELAQAGWTFSKSLDLLPEQYVLIFEAPKKANENPNG
jgi:hypothetical protein